MSEKPFISIIILAAGKSSRMGEPKMLLPWEETTVLGQVVAVLGICVADMAADFGADKRMAGQRGNGYEIIVVTGGHRSEVEKEVERLSSTFPVRCVFNKDYEAGEMLSSLQTALQAAHPSADAVLIGLGDQPQVREETVRSILRAFDPAREQVIIPSFEKRRGHPILINMVFRDELLALKPPATLRDFLNAHSAQIEYVDADATILQDLDTPEDYKRYQKS